MNGIGKFVLKLLVSIAVTTAADYFVMKKMDKMLDKAEKARISSENSKPETVEVNAREYEHGKVPILSSEIVNEG